MAKSKKVPAKQVIESSIVVLRREKVILDADLAHVYGVSTKRFNEAVKRNPARFPADFAFQLSKSEAASLRSQIATSKPGRGGRRSRPWAFTEHGAIMAAALLSSPKAIDMSLFVVRAFVRLRALAGAHDVLAAKLAELEKRVTVHDSELRNVIAALRALLRPALKPRRRIGYSPQP